MPIKIPNNLPAVNILEKENIFTMDEARAYSQDIRPLRILLLNLMPTKITTETQLLRLLGNSPLQVEFDFMYDILSALRIIKEQGVRLRIVLKVRGNGYREQYQEFVREYFPRMVDEFLDEVPIKSVLEKTDFYISLYSQTLFEASCLGIPCLFYKKDNQVIDPPFDGKSELVTVDNIDDLVKAFNDFLSGSARFDAFLEKSVMEKYVGYLDGNNLNRNLNHIYDLLK